PPTPPLSLHDALPISRPGEIENAVEIYVPLTQNPWFSGTLAVQTVVAPMSLLPAIKTAIARVDPLQVVTRVRTMEDVAAESTARSEEHTSELQSRVDL